MKTWATSDWHLGEDRFEIMQRPFTDVQGAVDAMIANHNALVAPNDLVYVAGDALYQKADPAVFLPQIDRFNGRKILIRGNHDRPFTDEQFAPYFEKIVAEGEGVEIECGGIACYLTHYPTLGRNNRFNLVGHIHGIWKMQLNSLNIGVDVHHFCPVDLSTIPFYHKAICEFYDHDAWACYQPCNEGFRGQRGKQSTYFTKA
jgi:calcineurin-like phosphoesterase family protein